MQRSLRIEKGNGVYHTIKSENNMPPAQRKAFAAFAVFLLVCCGPCVGSAALEDNFPSIERHLEENQLLSADALLEIEAGITVNASELQEDIELIDAAFDLVQSYEATQGPLFLNQRTRGGFNRDKTQGIELDRIFFALQQALLDHAYTSQNLKRAPELFTSKAYQTSAYFPGSVEAPLEPERTFETRIDASQIASYGYPQNGEDEPVRRPTGWYLPAGELALIKVPKTLVDKGYSIRVGAHSWDLKKKPKVTRLDRVSLVYPITEAITTIANPLGGSVYIEVPSLADAGIVTLQAKNLVESPFFSARAFDKTSLEEWQSIERNKQAPWTDFESDRFMMQVPTSWIYNFEDPVQLAAEYDKCLDIISNLTGRPEVRSKSVLYHQVDTTMRGGAFFPGYPQSNSNWNPSAEENGNKQHWMLKGPQHAAHQLFHEMGHHERITKFPGETEAIVNFLYVAVQNIGYGMDLDVAYSQSLGVKNQKISLDQGATSWMVTQNFRDGKPMNITNRPGDQVKYQHRGYGKYVEIVNLFGWDTIRRFWHTDQENYINGSPEFPKNINKDPIDSRILRLSIAANADLRPLIHFWGVQPVNKQQLEREIRARNLKPSAKIYDQLIHYKSVIPTTTTAFVQHAKIMYPNVTKPTTNPNLSNPLYGQGWYSSRLTDYTPEDGAQAAIAIDSILKTYFLNGRPNE